MPKGGKRPGAGRPKGSGKWRKPTVPVRLPVDFVEWINDVGYVLYRAQSLPSLLEALNLAAQKPVFYVTEAMVREVADK